MRYLAFLVLASCASTTTAPPPNKANPCATPGATYGLSWTERSGGTCGPISDQILIVGKDGTLPGTPLACRASTQTGCRAQESDCTSSTSQCHFTSDETFTSDGSSATGFITISCPNCVSTYSASATRL